MTIHMFNLIVNILTIYHKNIKKIADTVTNPITVTNTLLTFLRYLANIGSFRIAYIGNNKTIMAPIGPIILSMIPRIFGLT
ncbi:hypothetical protein [Peribacillus butanolivorans]|uniref:hypothetical protein n=1 Tax=Peribacillus butanolivorans TaxID=421767 RepID=UPI0020D21A5A|nr:hypothetical protein [Peribacillus butanolivorans]